MPDCRSGTLCQSRTVDVHPVRPEEAAAVGACLRHRLVVSDRLARQGRGECLYLVAWEGGAPTGQALLHWRRPQALTTIPGLDGLPYLEDVFVLPERRDRGIGTALLAAAQEAVATRGATGITLAVSVTNHGARRLYERLGYFDPGIPPHRQSAAEHGPDGVVRSGEETVVDLVRWLTPLATPARSAPGSSPIER